MASEPASPTQGPGGGRPPSQSRFRVLVVDDERPILNAYARVLSAAGFAVETAQDGRVAADLVRERRYDVIVSDLAMPGLSGIDLLRIVREHDLDVPVILATGSPTVETAVKAIEYGAIRYLVKPVEIAVLRKAVEQAVHLHQMAKVKREALALVGDEERQLGDRATLEVSFQRALRLIFMAYQPIVDWPKRQVFGYEALLRSNDSTLSTPPRLLRAAERIGRIHDLGRAVRAAVSDPAAGSPPPGLLFVNLHPRELDDETLYADHGPLANLASRVVLEVTERASLDDVRDLRSRIARLRKLGYRIAVDDLGAGYAGLSAFAQIEPDIVKLDMSLVRDVHREPTKRKVLQSMVSLCRDMSIVVIAEGVETPSERDAILDLGCELLQGYLFAKPATPYPAPAW
ncbi:MAG: EAL domain-containing protein [Deltaproteobacteria bacterium]|nr:EAL domain-containing protein [Deltaproteobacteria bacterium]